MSDSLVESALALEEVDTNLFVAPSRNLWRPPRSRGVFGGQVVGQALSAVRHTISSEKRIHSLHSQFLLPGNADRPIVYHVRKLHDGRSFCQRSVTAHQKGRPIFALLASLHASEESVVEHQLDMPSAAAPETLKSDAERYQELLADPRLPDAYRQVVHEVVEDRLKSPIEIRRASPQVDPFNPSSLPSEQLLWVRARGGLGDDPNLHTCALAFASDFLLLGTALRPHGDKGRPRMMASLDHSMWFHRPFRMDEWLLYAISSPRASGGRALCQGFVFTQDGTLVVSVMQEGVVRLGPPRRVGRARGGGDAEEGAQGEAETEVGGERASRSKL